MVFDADASQSLLPRVLNQDELAELYQHGLPPNGVRDGGCGAGPHLRANFVSSLDGSATVNGLSGPLGGQGDLAVLNLLRELADIVLVGAGTVRREGYGAMRVAESAARKRVASGLPAHPVFGIVSASLGLDVESSVFQDAPVPPIVFTTSSAPEEFKRLVASVAEVVECGSERCEPPLMLEAIRQRGLTRVLCEGGPSLFADFIEADCVDELCLSLDGSLVAGQGPRISHGGTAEQLRKMQPVSIVHSEQALLLRYRRT